MICLVHSGSGFFSPSRIPDPEVKKAPDPVSGSATLVVTPTVFESQSGSRSVK
jgi:hypothetical protein